MSDDIARKAGRGGVAVLAAKVYFIVVGLVQQALLKKVLGLAGYGTLALVLAPMNVVNNVVVASSTQGVSRAVVGHEDDRAVFRGAMRVHLRLALVAAIGFACAAPIIAYLELAPHILVPLLAATAIVGLYGTYAPMVGAVNGRGQFTRQATLDATFATLRTVLMLGVAYVLVRARLGVLGAVIGFAAAALAILPLAVRFAGTGKSQSGPGLETGAYLRGLWPIVVAQLATNLVMQSDISLLGRFLFGASQAREASDEWVGVYRACQLFAFLPYQLLMSVTQVLFPMVARAHADQDADAVRTYVARGVRLAAILGGGFVAVVVTAPGTMLRFAYDVEVADRGASTLRILALAQGMFALMSVGATVLSSLHQERWAARITAIALAASVTLCVVLVPRSDFGPSMLMRTAECVAGAMALALVLAALQVRKQAGAFLGWPTAARVGTTIGLLAFAGTYVPSVGRLLAPFMAIAVFVSYVLVLVVTGEIKRADVTSFIGMLRRR